MIPPLRKFGVLMLLGRTTRKPIVGLLKFRARRC